MNDSLAVLSTPPSRRAAFRLAVAATVTATLLSWGADLIKDAAAALIGAVKPCQDAACAWPIVIEQSLPLFAGLAYLLLGFLVAYRVAIPAARRALSKSAAVMQRDRKSRALILTLSNLPLPEELRPGQADEIALAKEAITLVNGASTKDECLAVLIQLCDPKGRWKPWKWQQPLRLLRHNFDTLEVIGFVLSDKAAPQFTELMQPLLSGLMPQMRVLFEQRDDGKAKAVDLSNYGAVTAALDRSCRAVLAEIQCETKDLCIDITSGTKAYSAAATVKTLNSTAIFSYVETETPFEVLTYDASLEI
jgi:hypothetical protein